MSDHFLFTAGDVSRETLAQLIEFMNLVKHWTRRINLVSSTDSAGLWDRHIKDSAQLHMLAPPDWRLWLDMGSGGGFPGIVVAIMAKAANPEGKVVLVESDGRKAAFLRAAIREFGLNAMVYCIRIEDMVPQNANVVSARALASLPCLIALSVPHLAPNGIALFPKGRRAAAEIKQAKSEWRFDLENVPSMTEPEATILRLKGLACA